MNRPTVIDYSPVAELARQIQGIQRRNQPLGRNTIVCIAGGSSTGKSTQLAADLHQQLADSQIIAQDSFQLGAEFTDQADPVYRWDAIANYGLPESAALLRALQAGESARIPVYSFRDFRRTGFRTIAPTPIVLFEGLYAGLSELRSIADLVIYAESPLYARMLRRLFRSCFERYRADPATALKSFLTGGVLKAHQDLVYPQRHTADVVFRMPYAFADSIRRFGLEKQPGSFPTQHVLFFGSGRCPGCVARRGRPPGWLTGWDVSRNQPLLLVPDRCRDICAADSGVVD